MLSSVQIKPKTFKIILKFGVAEIKKILFQVRNFLNNIEHSWEEKKRKSIY